MPAPGNQLTMRAAAWRTAAFAGALGVGYSAKATAAGATWFGMRGPFCPIGTCFGSLACPGCGLLRSTAAALQGDLSLAFACHPAGPVVAALLWLGLLLHLDLLRRGGEARWHRPAFTAGVLSFTISVIFGWLVRIGTAT